MTGLNHNMKPGFTLVEVLIAVLLFGLVMAGAIDVFIMCQKFWHATSLNMQAVRESSLALSRIVYGLETNNGLRAAQTAILNTNAHGHPYPAGINYWETGAAPPTAADATHWTHVGGGYGPDGSWRITISNISGDVKYLDYNIKVRNILFWPITNSMANRLLVCNYVSAATVTTNAGGTIGIQLTVEKLDGRFRTSNTVSTLVKLRNK